MYSTAILSAARKELCCPICVDLLDNPVGLPCGHCFCRLCAEKSIAASGKCPLCKSTTSSRALLHVPVLQRIVALSKRIASCHGVDDLAFASQWSQATSVGKPSPATHPVSSPPPPPPLLAQGEGPDDAPPLLPISSPAVGGGTQVVSNVSLSSASDVLPSGYSISSYGNGLLDYERRHPAFHLWASQQPSLSATQIPVVPLCVDPFDKRHEQVNVALLGSRGDDEDNDDRSILPGSSLTRNSSTGSTVASSSSLAAATQRLDPDNTYPSFSHSSKKRHRSADQTSDYGMVDDQTQPVVSSASSTMSDVRRCNDATMHTTQEEEEDNVVDMPMTTHEEDASIQHRLCHLCHLSVYSRDAMRDFLLFLLQRDATCVPAAIKEMTEASLEQLLGAMCGPFQLRGSASVYAHYRCLALSSEVTSNPTDGTLEHVSSALRRGNHIKCSFCGKNGATWGCALSRCKKSFHIPCAILTGEGVCCVSKGSRLLWCADHAGLSASQERERSK